MPCQEYKSVWCDAAGAIRSASLIPPQKSREKWMFAKVISLNWGFVGGECLFRGILRIRTCLTGTIERAKRFLLDCNKARLSARLTFKGNNTAKRGNKYPRKYSQDTFGCINGTMFTNYMKIEWRRANQVTLEAQMSTKHDIFIGKPYTGLIYTQLFSVTHLLTPYSDVFGCSQAFHRLRALCRAKGF